MASINRKASMVIAIGATLCVLCVLLIMFTKGSGKALLGILKEFFVWVYYYSFVWETTSNNIYIFSVIYAVLLCTLISVFSWFFCYKRGNTLVVLIIGLTMYSFMFYQNTTSVKPVAFYMFILSVV